MIPPGSGKLSHSSINEICYQREKGIKARKEPEYQKYCCFSFCHFVSAPNSGFDSRPGSVRAGVLAPPSGPKKHSSTTERSWKHTSSAMEAMGKVKENCQSPQLCRSGPGKQNWPGARLHRPVQYLHMCKENQAGTSTEKQL